MSNAKTHHPARIARAEERLEAAVARLDAAANQALGKLAEASAPDPAVEELRTENARLRSDRDELGGRLDQSIRRLSRLLEQ